MNTRELIDIVKKDGPMFVREVSNFNSIIQFVDYVFVNGRDVHENTLFYLDEDKWKHYDAELESTVVLNYCMSRNHIRYEPIDLDEFLAEHFAELL